MSGGYFTQAFVFLIRTAFDLYLLAVILRFLLQAVGADFYNPISQFLVKITSPALRPLRRLIPGYRGIDWASIALMMILKTGEICLIALIITGNIPALPGLLVLSLAQILNFIVYIFIIAIIIQVVLSWINPGAYNPATVILYRLTEPMLRPARRLIPSVGGLDLSPLLVLIFLQLTIILIVTPLSHLGQSLSGYLIR